MAHPRAAAMEARAKLLHENYVRVVENGGQPADPVLTPTEVVEVPAAVEVAPAPAPAAPQPSLGRVEVPPQSSNDSALQAELDAMRQQLERANAQNATTAETLKSERLAREQAEAKARKLAQDKEDAAASVITDERLQAEFTEKELNDFGIDQCRTMLRIADSQARKLSRAAASSAVAEQAVQTDARLKEIEGEKESLFFLMLETAHPDWKEINKKQAWLSWLGQVDPIARQTRQSLLNRARSVRDAAATIDMFSAYKATLPAAKNPAAGVLPTGRAPNAVPGDTRPPPAETLSRSWIREQTRLYSQKKISREAWNAIEQRINTAAVEGRITNS